MTMTDPSTQKRGGWSRSAWFDVAAASKSLTQTWSVADAEARISWTSAEKPRDRRPWSKSGGKAFHGAARKTLRGLRVRLEKVAVWLDELSPKERQRHAIQPALHDAGAKRLAACAAQQLGNNPYPLTMPRPKYRALIRTAHPASAEHDEANQLSISASGKHTPGPRRTWRR